MIKHQRRCYLRGFHSSELIAGGSSDFDISEPRPMLQQTSQPECPPNMTVSAPSMTLMYQHHRANSFAEFGPRLLDGFPLSANRGDRQRLSGGSPTYHSSLLGSADNNLLVANSLFANSSLFMPEKSNPAIATLNTKPSHIHTYHAPSHQHAQGMFQSNHGSYNPVSMQIPGFPDPYYTHQTTPVTNCVIPNSHPAQRPSFQDQKLPHQLAERQYYFTSPPIDQWYSHSAQAPVEFPVQIQTCHNQPAATTLACWKMEAFDNISLEPKK